MNERIAVQPHIHFGKPCVAGTRVAVQSVLELESGRRQFTHAAKKGRVTVSGQLGVDVPPKTPKNIWNQAQLPEDI